MKIIDIETFPVSFKPERPFANSIEWHESRATTLVKILTDEGVSGWGEAYGPPLGTSCIIETYIKSRLIGKDPFNLEFHWNKLQAHKGVPIGAIGGVDIALWDLKAKALNLPLYQLLGGKFIEEIVPYATGLYFCEKTPDSTYFLEKETLEIIDRGFKAVKMKVGFGKERDIKRVKKVREIIGESLELMVDANQAYDIMTCLELLPYFEEINIKWFEEPLPWYNFDGYRQLRSKAPFAIAGGEAETTYQGFIQAIKNQIVDVIQPDIPGAGGITNAKRIAVLADAFQMEFQPHVFGTILSLPAAVQLLASIPNHKSWSTVPRPVTLEWDTTPNKMVNDILEKPLEIKDGILKIPEKAGLGVEVNEAAIKKYLLR